MATCVDVAGAQYPETYKDSRSRRSKARACCPSSQGDSGQGHDALFWEHEGNRAVRQGKWKLVSRYPDKWELYDLEADRTELHDLAAANPARVKDMAAVHEAWAKRVRSAAVGGRAHTPAKVAGHLRRSTTA